MTTRPDQAATGGPPRQTPPARTSGPLLALAGAFLLILASLSAFAAGDSVVSGDVRVANAIQDAPVPASGTLARLGNLLGSSSFGVPFALLAVVLLFWRGWRADALLLLATSIARIGNYALKAFFDSPRPSPDLVEVTEIRGTLGFPSGHAMGAILLFGTLALIAWRRIDSRSTRWAAVGLCLLAVAVTGYARIETGAHWPTDVLGGYLWGIAILFGLVTLLRSGLALVSRAAP